MLKINIRERLKTETQGHSMYEVRKEEYKTKNQDNINFRVSPVPFKLTKSQKLELEYIGKAVCDYIDCCLELYKTNDDAREILDRGKPEKYRNIEEIKYLFFRPDIILTDSGFCICEIETSPFGLGLAEVLNRTYGNEGYDTIVKENELKNYIQSQIPNVGTIAYSEKVKAFKGQLSFMAEQIFSDGGKTWNAIQIEDNNITNESIYRAFYLNEQFTDKYVANLLDSPKIYLPSLTPQFEEKALLSFIWDKRYINFLENKLGKADFDFLRKVIPKTWILGQEQYVDGGLPDGKQDSLNLADLSKKNRKFVLKQSGFSTSSSWGEGVMFLHKMSGQKALKMLELASDDKEHLYIVQQFNQGKNVPMTFINQEGVIEKINAKVRITPYYSYMGRNRGELIAAKVTGCENTEYIHAGTSSINTAVSYERNTGFERD